MPSFYSCCLWSLIFAFRNGIDIGYTISDVEISMSLLEDYTAKAYVTRKKQEKLENLELQEKDLQAKKLEESMYENQ